MLLPRAPASAYWQMRQAADVWRMQEEAKHQRNHHYFRFNVVKKSSTASTGIWRRNAVKQKLQQISQWRFCLRHYISRRARAHIIDKAWAAHLICYLFPHAFIFRPSSYKIAISFFLEAYTSPTCAATRPRWFYAEARGGLMLLMTDAFAMRTTFTSAHRHYAQS